MIFLEAINQYGGISADWVLVGVTSLLGIILIALVKSALNKIATHERRLNLNDVQHAKFEEQIKSGIELNAIINKAQDDKLGEISLLIKSMKA